MLSSAPVISRNVSLKRYTTLKAGGAAEHFAVVGHVDELAVAAMLAQGTGMETTVLGWGSNVLPSDEGVPGLVVLNKARRMQILRSGEVLADTGCGLQELFLKTAQVGLHGLEFAVGIPGTLGGALVSNAGAYRSSICEFLVDVEIVHEGRRRWVEPSWLEFSYRDSIFRRTRDLNAVMLQVRLKLPCGDPLKIYDEAREYQRQRISKQPAPASAGSFFKNVNDPVLAFSLPSLPEPLRMAGVVPAGFLIEGSGLKGFRMGGAMFGARHANFILNVGGASAFDIRRLAEHARKVVFEKYRVNLEEEVLYLGDWSRFRF